MVGYLGCHWGKNYLVDAKMFLFDLKKMFLFQRHGLVTAEFDLECIYNISLGIFVGYEKVPV